MRPLVTSLWRALCSRAISPVVLAFFLILYIALAFATDEALVALMSLTAASLLLQLPLAILPLSALCRLVEEIRRSLQRRRLLRGQPEVPVPEELFDERVQVTASRSWDRIGPLLASQGYTTRCSESALGAWRGGGVSAARVLFLAATFSLFAGILVSVATRDTHRGTVAEGEPLPTADGTGGIVEKISLVPSRGLVLAQDVRIQVAPSRRGEAGKEFSLYPPSLYRGYFVYPRYLGIAPEVALSAPDLPQPYSAYHVFNIYPPGREDKADLPGTPYRIMVSLEEAADRSDPFVTGRGTMLFKLFRGNDLVVSGRAPLGGEVAQGGYRVAFPTWKRIVQTDFVHDFGVPLIWLAGILFPLAALLWLPARIFFPRREMLFLLKDGALQAYSRAEGKRRGHGGVFNEVLDLLEP